jgi:hypothetical protein
LFIIHHRDGRSSRRSQFAAGGNPTRFGYIVCPDEHVLLLQSVPDHHGRNVQRTGERGQQGVVQRDYFVAVKLAQQTRQGEMVLLSTIGGGGGR